MLKNILDGYSYYLIIDLEATCCDKNTVPREAMEIIEIGAVLVDANTLQPIDEYTTFIKPIRYPTLTSFCTELTTITQEDVNNAPEYTEAIQGFKQWFNHYQNFVFCSWGDYDYKQFKQDSHYHQLPFPIDAPHVNIKKVFAEQLQLPRPCGMHHALRQVGLKLKGTHHRGIDDARNMARLMPWIIGK